MADFRPPCCPTCRSDILVYTSIYSVYCELWEEEVLCPICFAEVLFGDYVLTACPNKHIFHANCINRWINKTPTPWPCGAYWLTSTTCHHKLQPNLVWDNVLKDVFLCTYDIAPTITLAEWGRYMNEDEEETFFLLKYTAPFPVWD